MNITPNLQSVIEQINSGTGISEDQIINLMRVFSMESNSMNISEIFVLMKDGRFSHSPIKPHILHGEMGDILMEKYINELKKSSEVQSVLEFNFGHGIVAKIKKSELTKEVEDRFKDIEDRFKKNGGAGIENEPEYQDYFIVNVMNKNNICTKIYDVITAGDAFVISDKPLAEHENEYDNNKFINYIK